MLTAAVEDLVRTNTYLQSLILAARGLLAKPRRNGPLGYHG